MYITTKVGSEISSLADFLFVIFERDGDNMDDYDKYAPRLCTRAIKVRGEGRAPEITTAW